MLRAIGASALAFCTFFITPVSASFDRPVDLREVVSASWDLVEISAQLAATAAAEGRPELAEAAGDLRTEAAAWYVAVRGLGDANSTLAPDAVPAAQDEMSQAFEDVAGRMDESDGCSPELRTLWRMTQTRMRNATHATRSQADALDR